MTNQEAVALHAVGMGLKDRKDLPIKFAWALMRTMKKVEADVISTIQELTKQTQAYQEYEKARRALCEATALRDEEGALITEDGKYTFPNGEVPDMTALHGVHKEAIEERTNRISEVNKIMTEPYEGGVHTVSIEFVPPGLDLCVLSALDPMIEG